MSGVVYRQKKQEEKTRFHVLAKETYKKLLNETKTKLKEIFAFRCWHLEKESSLHF